MFGGAFLMLYFSTLPILIVGVSIGSQLQEVYPEITSSNKLRIENTSIFSFNCGQRACFENEICKKLSNDVDKQCVCKEGFSRSTSGICEPNMDSVTDIVSGVLVESAIPFRIEGPTTVRLPQNTVNLSIVFEGSIDRYDTLNYTYYWEVLDGGGFGSADTYTEPVLALSGLKEGVIRLRATVSNGSLRSYRDVSLKILSEKKPNKPPVALIRPASPLYAVEGSRVVLDAEGSSDEDDTQLDFEWKLLNGPVVQLPAMNTAILRLDNLLVGNYSFGLTVKDKEGATDHRTVDIIVSAKRDDPPKAQITECGEQVSRSTIDVRLPMKTLLLCANISTDDYGITSYKWFRIDNLITQLAVDYSGSSTPVLKLTNLQANEKFGPYIFRLEVSDASGQTDSATISILVNKAVNRPPQPDAGSNQTIQLPIASAVLNGNVKDDGEIIRYQWTQISGPNEVMIVNGDKSKCTVSGFEEGVYQFRLNVTDDGGLTATDDTFVTVVRSKNEPPVARAPNVTVYLPSNLAILNGSESFDDAGIVRYMWSAHDDVPACIAFLGLSSDQSIAMLGGLVPGIFHFDLTVTDHSNAQNSTTVALTVVAGEEQLNSIEMYLEPDFNDITYRLRNKLEGRIATTLAVQIPEAIKVDVRFSSFAQDPSSGRLRVVFHTEFANPIHQEGEGAKSAIVVSAARAVTILRNEVDMIRDFHIASINTLYCVLDCSGHGKCSNYSKECHCDRYWMPNLFNYLLRGSKLDCSWSILYFGLFIVVTFVFVASCIVVRFRYRTEFAMTEWRPSKNRALSRRRRRRRFRRNDEELHSNGQISGTSKLNESSASYSLLMPSDSLSSENETELSTTNANRHAIVEQDGVELRGRPSVPFTE